MSSEPPVTLLELVDALIVFDGMILDHRFQQAIRSHPSESARARLAEVPSSLAHGARVTRRAGVKWEEVAGRGVELDLLLKAEHFLLNAVLQASEEQARLKVFLARHAPTREVREHLDEALAVHYGVTRTLRDALKALPAQPRDHSSWSPARPVAAEHPSGDIRNQLEREVRRLRERGFEPSVVHMSPTALRHLRDQGLFRDGTCTVDGVHVVLEMAWSGTEYAISTVDAVPLEEVMGAGD